MLYHNPVSFSFFVYFLDFLLSTIKTFKTLKLESDVVQLA